MLYHCTYKSELLTSNAKPHCHSLCELSPFKREKYILTAEREKTLRSKTVLSIKGNNMVMGYWLWVIGY